VVVLEGVLLAVPEAGTESAPGAIETDVAPETSQSSIVVSPSLIFPGLAVNESITGKASDACVEVISESVSSVTSIVTARVVLPKLLEAVRI
jgi:hypothetical protein